MSMNLFARITKVDEAQRLVYGRVTQEVVDNSDEILDYEKSKPYFKAWSDSFKDATDGKSVGNMRAMHGKVAAGKFTGIEFNDAEKAIDMCGKVVDDAEWTKCLEGVYTGFSIGGRYVGERTTEKAADGREIKRFVANPSEVSLVDNPCVPTAKFFDVIKVDGKIEKVAFKPAPTEINGTAAQVDELTALLNTHAKSLGDALEILKRDFTQAERDKAAKEGDAMPDGSFPIKNASDLENAIHLAGKAKDPAAARAHIKRRAKDLGAEDKIPDTWKVVASTIELLEMSLGTDDDLRKQFGDVRGAELDALLAKHMTGDEVAAVVKAAPPAALTKSLIDAVIAKAKMSAANMDRLQAAHDHLVAMGADCDSDAEKNKKKGDLNKGVGNAELTTLREELKAAQENIKKLMDQPAPHVMLRAVPRATPVDKSTTTDIDPDLLQLTADDVKVKNFDGTVDVRASRLLKAQKLSA